MEYPLAVVDALGIGTGNRCNPRPGDAVFQGPQVRRSVLAALGVTVTANAHVIFDKGRQATESACLIRGIGGRQRSAQVVGIDQSNATTVTGITAYTKIAIAIGVFVAGSALGGEGRFTPGSVTGKTRVSR